MSNELRFTIPLDPKTKKNNQQIVKVRGRYMLIQNKRYREYERAAGEYLPKLKRPIDEPVVVKAVFFRGSKRRVDKANLEEALDDILVHHGVLADDNRDIIASTDGTRVLYDKSNPRTEVTIAPLNEYYERWKTDEGGVD